MGTYEYFDHTADIGMRIAADSFEELLSLAGRGLTELIVARPETIAETERRSFELRNTDRSLLMFDLLSEMLFLFEVDQLVFCKVLVTVNEPDGIKVELAGE